MSDKFDANEYIKNNSSFLVDDYIKENEHLLEDKPSYTESAVRGLVQGVYPLIDETVGAVSSPIGAIKSLGGITGEDVSQDSDVQEYIKARDDYRKLDELARSTNPATFGVSEGAGVVGTFLVPGAAIGRLGKAAEVAGSAAKAYKFGEKPFEAARFAGELGRDASIAAGQMVAATESDLTRGDVEGISKDIALGAALGAGGRTAAESLPKLYKAAEGVAVVGKPLEALRKGAEGVAAFTESQRKKIIDKFMTGAKLTLNELEDLRSLLGEGIGTIESQAISRGTKFNIGDILKTSQKELESIPVSGIDIESRKKMSEGLGKFLREEAPSKRMPDKIIPATPGTKKELEDEAKLLMEQAKLMGINLDASVEKLEVDGKKYLTIKKTLKKPETEKVTANILNEKEQALEKSKKDLLKSVIEDKPVLTETQPIEDYFASIKKETIPEQLKIGTTKPIEESLPTSEIRIPGQEVPGSDVRSLENEPLMGIEQAQATKRGLQNLSTDLAEKAESGAFEKSMSPKFTKAASNVTKEIEKVIPELGEMNKAYKNVLGVYEDLGLSKEALNLMEVNPKAALDVQKELVNTMESVQDVTKKGAFSRSSLDNALSKLKQIPEVGTDLANKIEQKMGELVENYQFQKRMSPSQEIGAQFIKGAAQATNIAGLGLGKIPKSMAVVKSIPLYLTRKMSTSVDETIQQPKDLSKSLYSASNDDLTGISNTLSNEPEVKYLGEALNKAISNNDTQAKNAALFAIMQNPKARKLIQPAKVE